MITQLSLYYSAVVEKSKKIPKMVFPSPNKSFQGVIKIMKITKNDGWSSKTIYNRILVLCEERGWTLTRLAELAAMNTSTIYTYRYRESMPKIETLVEICEVFDITLAQFFMLEDKKNEELIRILNGLSDSSKELLKEVAKRMRE